MNRRWHLRRSLGLLALAALAGCTTVPERDSAPAADSSGPPVMATIPEPVPVEVPAGGLQEATEAEALAGGPATEPVAEAPAPVGNLLDRVRTGLELGEHYQIGRAHV